MCRQFPSTEFQRKLSNYLSFHCYIIFGIEKFKIKIHSTESKTELNKAETVLLFLFSPKLNENVVISYMFLRILFNLQLNNGL